MQSNRDDLALLPEFASRWGREELDVRYVSPSFGVDVTNELLSEEDPAVLNAELERAARDAVRRGIRLSAFPDFESPADLPRDPVRRARRRLWRLRAGIDKAEHVRYALNQRLHGCAYPGRDYVIRPNGAVSPLHLLAGGSHRLLPGAGPPGDLRGRRARADSFRPAFRRAGWDVRDLLRAAHRALSIPWKQPAGRAGAAADTPRLAPQRERDPDLSSRRRIVGEALLRISSLSATERAERPPRESSSP